jgi:hypothetical protein
METQVAAVAVLLQKPRGSWDDLRKMLTDQEQTKPSHFHDLSSTVKYTRTRVYMYINICILSTYILYINRDWHTHTHISLYLYMHRLTQYTHKVGCVHFLNYVDIKGVRPGCLICTDHTGIHAVWPTNGDRMGIAATVLEKQVAKCHLPSRNWGRFWAFPQRGLPNTVNVCQCIFHQFPVPKPEVRLEGSRVDSSIQTFGS